MPAHFRESAAVPDDFDATAHCRLCYVDIANLCCQHRQFAVEIVAASLFETAVPPPLAVRWTTGQVEQALIQREGTTW